MRPVGAITRGTTNPNRLRRVDNWIAATLGGVLRRAPDPLVVDLGYGASPITAIELRARLGVPVVGLEIDPERVAAAQPYATPDLQFRLGGFELAGLRPTLVRAFNVLRQYDEADVPAAWAAMTATGALLVEGTCDELGRLAAWVLVSPAGPRTLTLASRLANLDNPGTLAERLPKCLIHHNVPGERIHALLSALDAGWRAAAPLSVFGPRQRWRRAVESAREAGWPVLDRPSRWRLGEITVPYPAVAPVS
ncbi:class I SAM-dependent methyltransferase [Dactylosporangium sp. NPDC000555]|uniref:class I SAM-dependent methyltransferase n=1 Tax=Dactylosporangium sp. NPDC000555 TaxID=3154260 RepID=UPI00332FB96B